MAATPAIPELDLQQLNDRFAIPGVAQIVAGNDGQPKIKITSVAASAEIYLHGAHITSWIPAGAEEVLFLSSKAQFQEGKAIRGGVPDLLPLVQRQDRRPQGAIPRPRPHQIMGTRIDHPRGQRHRRLSLHRERRGHPQMVAP